MQMYANLFNELISTDYGLMSFIVILFTIAMSIYFTILFMGKIGKSTPPSATMESPSSASEPH